MSTTGLLHVLGLASALLAATAPCRAAELLGASSNEHLWVVVPPRSGDSSASAARALGASAGEWTLLHLHPDMAAGVRIATTFASEPAALAAAGDRLWIVFRPPPGDNSAGEVWTVRAVHNEVLGVWFSDPLDRLDLQPALPEASALEAFTADGEGPVALLRLDDTQRGIVRLRGDRWIADDRIPPPAPLDRSSHPMARLTATGLERTTLVLVDVGDTSPVWLRRPRQEWESLRVPLPGVAASLTSTSDLTVAATVDGPELALFALRGDQPVALGRVARPEEPWVLLGMEGGLRLLSLSGKDGALEMRGIDPRRPESASLMELGSPRGQRSMWLHVPILGGVALGVAMLLLLVRSERIGAVVPLPAGLVPVDLPQRAMGAIIDYVPAAVVVWLATGCPMLDLITLPIWTMPFDRAAPPLAALLLSVLVAGACEAIWGTSLGKRWCRARVVGVDGARPAAWRAFLRAVLKFIVLSMPVLGVFHLLNPQKRGLPDLLANSTVLRPPGEPEQPQR